MRGMTMADARRHEAPAQDRANAGSDAISPWRMSLRDWKDVILRAAKETSADNAGLVAAGVSFYGFLALLPMLGAVVLTYGFLAEPDTVIQNMTAMTRIMPADIARLVGEQLMYVVQTSSEKKGMGVIVALALALFSARNGAAAIVTALNIAYEEEEKRGFIKVNLLALAITAAAVLMAVLALLAVAVVTRVEALLPASPLLAALFKVASYVVLVALAAAAAAALYRFGPSRERARWTWLSPGSALFAVLWVALTLSFGSYVSNFGNYSATYGSLAAVVILLTWLYLSSYLLVFGGELNSELEHQTRRDTTDGPERPLGTRGAWAADHAADGSGEHQGNPEAGENR